MLISICISTYKRPLYLKQLLEEIDNQELDVECTIKVIIVDNDINQSAKEVYDIFSKNYTHGLVYSFESRKGISYSRNKAFSLADENSDFVVFVDDDEYPQKDWIANLLKMQQASSADLVEGMVIQQFSSNAPKWIIKGKFLLMPHFVKLKNGDDLPINAVMTGNLLVRYSLMKKIDGPFNEALSLTGGEDSDLGFNLAKLGCKMVFCNKAIVYEHTTEQRTTFKWVMQRAYSDANKRWVLCQDKSLKNWLKFFVLGALRIAFGISIILPALIASFFLGLHVFYKIIRIIIRGMGILSGLLNIRYKEYAVSYTSNNA